MAFSCACSLVALLVSTVFELANQGYNKPGTAQVGAISKAQNVQVLVNWGPFNEKKIEKFHNAKKMKGGPFGLFQHPFCRKISKIEGSFGEKFFSTKSLTEPKILQGSTLWIR